MEERLKQFIDSLNMSINAFEKGLGVGTGTISKTITGKKALGSDIIKKIIFKYPDLSLNWLFYGEDYFLNENGIFPRSENEKPVVKTGSDAGSVTKNELSVPVFEQKQVQELVIQYQAMSTTYKQEVEVLKTQIATLAEQLSQSQQQTIEAQKEVIQAKNALIEAITPPKTPSMPLQQSVPVLL